MIPELINYVTIRVAQVVGAAVILAGIYYGVRDFLWAFREMMRHGD